MAIFFCTFLALRAQDDGRPIDNIKDYELDGEDELFGGYVSPVAVRCTMLSVDMQPDYR
jgi:hypothetical protein